MNNSSKINIGTCAWSCDDWKGAFYPAGLPENHWLEFYARHFSAVEIDSTFYHAPTPHAAAHWNEQTPADFRFALKMPREITHELKLRDCTEKVGAFMQSIEPLRSKLACVVVQLPPGFTPQRDERELKKFVLALPDDVRFAIEFRQPAWHLPRIVRFFEQHRIAWVWSDLTSIEEQNRAAFEFLPQTTDLVYIRLLGDSATMNLIDHSSEHRYGTLMWPRDSSLDSWAVKIQRHVVESDSMLIFAGNHFEGFAPLTCQRIATRLGLPIELPAPVRPDDERERQIDLL